MEKQIWQYIQVVIAAIGGWVGYFVGGYDGIIYTLVAFIVIDYITGVMLAIVEKKLCSDIGYVGIFKKALILILVGVGHFIDLYLIENGNALRTTITFFYISNEGLSILENASKLGLPIPKKIQDVLAQLSKSNDKGTE